MGGAARGLSGICAAVALALAPADATAAECPEVKNLLRATQTQASLSGVTAGVRLVITYADDQGLSTAEMERLHDLAIDAYSPLELTSDIQHFLEANCNAEAVANALAFYRSSTGVKLMRGSLALQSGDPRRDKQAYFQQLVEEGLSSGRLDAVRSVKGASLSFETPPRVRVALLRPLELTTLRAIATEQNLPAPTEAEFEEVLTAVVSSQNAVFDLQSDLALLFATRDLSVAELQEVRSFLGSSTGVWYREAMSRAFEEAIEKAGVRFTAAAAAPTPPPEPEP